MNSLFCPVDDSLLIQINYTVQFLSKAVPYGKNAFALHISSREFGSGVWVLAQSLQQLPPASTRMFWSESSFTACFAVWVRTKGR